MERRRFCNAVVFSYLQEVTVVALCVMMLPLFCFAAVGFAANENAAIQSAVAPAAVQAGEKIGSGDGRIHVIPSLSSPSVKNGGQLKIQSVVKAVEGGAAYPYQTFSFAWITDPHVMPSEWLEQPLEAMQACIADVNATSDILDFVIDSGDLTETGWDELLELYDEARTSFTIPLYYVPGNHETRWTESALVGYHNILGDEHFFFEHNGIYFIGINSSILCRIGIANIAPQELQWLADRLAEVNPPDAPIILVMHHPPKPQHLPNQFPLLELIRDYRVVVILCGHLHSDGLLDFFGIPIANAINLFAPPYRYKVMEVSLSSIEIKTRYCSGSTNPTLWTFNLPPPAYPSVTITGVSEGEIVSGNIHVDLYSTASLTSCEYKVTNGLDFYSPMTGSGQNWQQDIDTAALPNGVHRLVIKFNDGAGDWYQSVRFISDNSYPQAVWMVNVGYGIESSPSCADGRVFFGADDGKVYALNLADGTQCWPPVQTGGPVLSSPAVYDGKVFVGSADGKLYVIDAATGSVLWTYQTGNSIISSPVAEGGAVYFGSNDKKFYGLDIATQTQLWPPFEVGGHIECKPCLHNGVLYFGCFDTYLYALNASTGIQVWKWQGHTSWYRSPAYCWPVVGGGKVFECQPGGNKGGIDLATGIPVWENNSPKVYSSIGISEDSSQFYGRSYSDGKLYAWETAADTQTELWSSPVGYGTDYNPSMPMEKDGTLFTGSQIGFVVAVDPSDGAEQWRYYVDETVTNTVCPINGHSLVVTTIGGTVAFISNMPSPTPTGVKNWQRFE